MTLTLDSTLAHIQAQISGQRCGACLRLDEANFCLLKQRPVSPERSEFNKAFNTGRTMKLSSVVDRSDQNGMAISLWHRN